MPKQSRSKMVKRNVARKTTRTVDRRMHDYGDADKEKKKIRVNPGKGDVVDTMVHEELHVKHPGWNEKRVKAATKKSLNRMSITGMKRLLTKYEGKGKRKG